MINDSIKFTHRHHQATIIIIAGKWQQYTRVWPQCVYHARMRMDWIRFDSIDEQTDRQTSVHAFWFVCATLLLLAFFSKISWLLLFWYGCCWCCYDTIFWKSIAANGFERQTDRHVVCFFLVRIYGLCFTLVLLLLL